MSYVEERYAIPIIITDVIAPFTVAHLFGHTIQWNLSESGRTIGNQLPYPNVSAARMQELYDYELAAVRYSLALFHQARLTQFDQWISDYFQCDWAYLSHFYKTGERLEFRPSVWKTRGAGIVV